MTRQDCAAEGAHTIIRREGLVDNEMHECVDCRVACRWDMTEHHLFGFAASCPHREKKPVDPDTLKGDDAR